MSHLTVCQCLMRFKENGTKMYTVYTIDYHILVIYICNYRNYAITNVFLQLIVFTTRFPTNSDGGHRANCIEDLIEHGLPSNSSNQEIGRSLTCLVKWGVWLWLPCMYCLFACMFSVEVETNGLLDGIFASTKNILKWPLAAAHLTPGTGQRNGRSLIDNS